MAEKTLQNREALQAELFRLLQEIAPELDPAQVAVDRPLRDQVDIDSMDFLAFIGKIYETLGVDIPETEYGKLRTVQDLVAYLGGKLKII